MHRPLHLNHCTMKVYQQIISALFTGALLFLSLTLGAQGRPGHPHPPRPGFGLEELQGELQLTQEQQAQLQVLKATLDEQREALKDQEFDSQEARHEAFKKLMDEHKAGLDKILTDEQEAQLHQLWQERRHQPRPPRLGKEEGAQMRAEMKAYRDENIAPVMRAQRAELEKKLSPEDKAQIAALRSSFAEMRQEKRALKQNEDKKPEDFQQLRESHKADMETLKGLAEKYDTDIDALMQEIKPQQEKWHQDMRAITQKYRPEPKPGEGKAKEGHQWHRGPRGPHHGLPGRPGMHKGRFLLLDPNAAEAPAAQPVISKTTVFPNPANSEMTLQYTLEKAGDVRIELRDKEGNLLKAVKEGPQQAGPQSITVDAAQLQEGIYYLAVISQGQQVTQKVVVARR